MNRNFTKTIFTLAFLFSVFTIAYPQGDDTGDNPQLKAIKERMNERLPSIIALKDQCIVGEKKDGFLAFVGNDGEILDTPTTESVDRGKALGYNKEKMEDLVGKENTDRGKIYELIANNNSVPIQAVAESRAKQLAEQAPSGGHYIEANGKFIKK